MKKKLEEMTLEELWALFPIFLEPHNNLWALWADEEIKHLSSLLSRFHPILSHIGSTAIPEIEAKPIVDILVEIAPDREWGEIRKVMERNGYICMSTTPCRMSFNKGYTPDGYAEKVFHIHFHPAGDHDEILFRDYLISNPQIAKEYEKLKKSLLPAFRNNRDGYTDAKSDFIKRIMQMIPL